MKKVLLKGQLILLMALSIYSCKKDEEVKPIVQPVLPAIEAPEVLDCNAFSSNITLIDYPNRPIDYIINCKIRVNASVVINPGVVIAFDQNAGINISGNSASFVAEGTADKPITFTGKEQVKGYWAGIISFNNNPINSLKYCTVEYAGGDSFNSNGDKGNIILYASGALKIDNCIIRKGADVGLRANYGNSEFSSSNSVYTENLAPMNIEDKYIGVPNSSDDYTGNATDRILLRHYTSRIGTETAKKINVPYRFTGGITAINEVLTVEAGVEFEMATGAGIKVEENQGKGGIKMVGSVNDSIRVYGMLDVSGGWKNIYIDGENPINEMAFVSFKNGGQDPTSSYGVVKLWYDALLNIHDVTFIDTKSPACAIAYRLLGGQVVSPNLTIGSINLVNTDCESKEY